MNSHSSAHIDSPSSCKISLGEFLSELPADGCVAGRYASEGLPTDREILLGDPAWPTPFDVAILCRLTGTIDADGTWRWDGEGDLRDHGRNAVAQLGIWHDSSGWILFGPTNEDWAESREG